MATSIPQTTAREIERRRKQVNNFKQRKNARRLLLHAILLVCGFFWVYPFLWALGSSLKSEVGFFSEGLSFIPKEFQWQNYADAWTQATFGQYFFNTVIITVLTVAFTLTFTSMAGFVLARTNFPGKKWLVALIAITLFLPHGYTIVPVFDLIQRLGLLDTLWSVIVVETAGNMVFSTFLFMGYFATIDRELEDAARVDGANFHQLFWQVMFPLARPMLATLGLFTFINSWNNFLIPLVFTLGNSDLRTLPVGLYAFIAQTSTNWVLLCAASMISLVPTILVFVFTQRHVINAFAGAVKG
ncbi:carbohydrate ABC transporter permease [Dictyobacter arantiisoli]|uniref:Sugar ABC transporter permease n=1 Tax=Dictyobacter arantiisoli TaxID=2014874 RepID=A0A5A5TAU7_9CHLR|nr:carbohydrate ABC transporter permease [Dictyobacter arantiisoli]GCF08528.1 sugar ABC transporter permease [Dictyobacter arantiisoli]